ncbi:unnamed protein product [Parascedosporium putredinis]|uniref:NAD(P)-binding protein n=1 Tax=Parascedosporium putredinis TaxID=1442378 RepID=A0A9P1H056_9PEZI|nr:unnamed protein product [Parascedosporium putredinis]CAI7992452.1 unnamed protein product [Parascedosporium putredinis]
MGGCFSSREAPPALKGIPLRHRHPQAGAPLFHGPQRPERRSHHRGNRRRGASVPVTFLQCDLGSAASVREAADKFLAASSSRLDVLVANAGVMSVPPGLTADGHEVQWGTNFFGHAVLIHLLLPAMVRTAELPGADVRLLLATSQGHGLHPVRGPRGYYEPVGKKVNPMRSGSDDELAGRLWEWTNKEFEKVGITVAGKVVS